MIILRKSRFTTVSTLETVAKQVILLGTDWTDQFFLFIKLTTTLTITSFSSVRLSAIISVRATSVLSAAVCSKMELTWDSP